MKSPILSIACRYKVCVPAELGLGMSEPLFEQATVWFVAKSSYEYSHVTAVDDAQFTDGIHFVVVALAVGEMIENCGTTAAPPLIFGLVMNDPPSSA